MAAKVSLKSLMPVVARYLLMLVVFWLLHFLIPPVIDVVTKYIFSINYAIGRNQWNDWVFDYLSYQDYLRSFWGVLTTDFITLFTSIYVALHVISSTRRTVGWWILLVTKSSASFLFALSLLYFSRDYSFSALATTLWLFMFPPIVFLAYTLTVREG